MRAKANTGKIRQTYEFIKANGKRFNVRTMCRVLEVAPSGYYAWLQDPVCQRALEDVRLLRLIRASFTASHGIYGAPRVFLDLREAGETCSKHRVMRLMRVNKIRAVRGYRIRHSSASKPSELIPNILQRNFDVASPNKAWVTDITYISHLARLALPRRSHGSILQNWTPWPLRLLQAPAFTVMGRSLPSALTRNYGRYRLR
jgi:putative transposase